MAWDHNKERKAAKKMSIASSLFSIVFLAVWCVIALSMGAGFMLLFGIPVLGMQIYRLYVFIQLGNEEKQPKKEADPWEQPAESRKEELPAGQRFCPYCGCSLEESFAFCPKCGRKQN